MKRILVLLYMILACAWSCEKGNITDTELVDTDWVLTQIQDTKTGDFLDFPSDAQREISIFLDGDSNALYFTGICNFGSGTYEFTSSRGKIHISDIVTTLMACNHVDWEIYTARNLEDNSGYRIDGDKLEVYSNGTHNLIFTRE
ncbi:MAG: META domain-containing protein [Bacteroidales bacterium]|jgi:heat shock protein HslJ|nr:META domain-containing protein [Bacteroidales bacterium]